MISTLQINAKTGNPPINYRSLELKTELLHHCQFKMREDAWLAIFEYIEVLYNRERIYFANDYLSPVDYEIQQKTV